MKKTKIIQKLIILLFFLVAGGIYTGSKRIETAGQSEPVEKLKEEVSNITKEPTATTFSPSCTKSPTKPEKIIVHICGEVKHPGIVELLKGARIADAVKSAGGASTKASLEAINLAEILVDGERIYVPSKEEVTNGLFVVTEKGLEHQSDVTDQTKVNLNLAAKDQLMTLPGIGEVKAEAIVTYRVQHGAFASITEVKKVEGIKDAVYEKIKDMITAD